MSSHIPSEGLPTSASDVLPELERLLRFKSRSKLPELENGTLHRLAIFIWPERDSIPGGSLAQNLVDEATHRIEDGAHVGAAKALLENKPERWTLLADRDERAATEFNEARGGNIRVSTYRQNHRPDTLSEVADAIWAMYLEASAPAVEGDASAAQPTGPPSLTNAALLVPTSDSGRATHEVSIGSSPDSIPQPSDHTRRRSTSRSKLAIAGGAIAAVGLAVWVGFGQQTVEPTDDVRAEVLADIAMGGSARGARLAGADLRGIDFREIDLRDAHLAGANLAGADFGGANLEGADMVGANLSGAVLVGSSLNGAKLRDTNLDDADFTDAVLTQADLRGASSTRTDFRRASLLLAVLSEIEGDRTEFIGSTLTSAQLFGAQLPNADMTGAAVSGADFSGATLTGADFSAVQCSETTVWPSSGKPIKAACSDESTLAESGDELDLAGSDLTDIKLGSIDLEWAQLPYSNLTNASFLGTELDYALLRGSVLVGSQLSGADLDYAVLSGADFRDAILTDIQLREALLVGARFDGARLSRVDVRGADFSLSDIGSATLNDVLCDSATIWPDPQLGTKWGCDE